MGEAPTASKKPAAAKVRLVVRASAHVDVADLDAGCVSKTKPLVVDAATAKRLLAAHPYLEATEG
jgi:hypothetical protein